MGGLLRHSLCSKRWRRKHSDPLATGQKWYCNVCGTTYKTRYGMLVEVHLSNGAVFWIRGEFADEYNDIKHMAAAERHAEARTPMELYHAIQEITPFMGDGFLRPARPDEVTGGDNAGVYRIVPREAFQSVQAWSFSQLMAFVRA